MKGSLPHQLLRPFLTPSLPPAGVMPPAVLAR